MNVPPLSLEGKCLIASPHLNGSPFAHTLILVTHDDPEDGSLGVIFNKNTRYTLGDFLESVSPSLKDTPIFNGGPVDTTVLTIIALSYAGNALFIKSHLTPPMAEAFLKEHSQHESSQIRSYLGYAGWSPGQLQSELVEGDWQLLPFTPALLEPLPGERLWAWANEQAK